MPKAQAESWTQPHLRADVAGASMPARRMCTDADQSCVPQQRHSPVTVRMHAQQKLTKALDHARDPQQGQR